jgi:site-specific recombinase XerD
VIITGKGRKTRQVPICQESATALIDYMKGRDLRERIFQNARGLPLTRFGISHIIQTRTLKAATTCPSLAKKKVTPHTFRHTTAMHLLQSGVELTVIKSWLGHVQISTTHAYMEIDLKMKQKALGQCMSINNASKLDDLIRQNENVISWLDSL